MPKNSIIPPAILSFVKKNSSVGDGSGDRHDDDCAFLLPSYGSSFNLTGDSEYLLSKSTSQQSNHSRSSKSSASRGTSGASSGGSSGGSGHRQRHHHGHHSRGSTGSGRQRHHRHHRSGSNGGGGKVKKKRRSSQPQQQQELDSSHLSSARTSSSFSSESAPARHSSDRLSGLTSSTAGGDESPAKFHQHRPRQSSLDFALRKTTIEEQDADGYLVGYGSDPNDLPTGMLSPIAGSFRSEQSTSSPAKGAGGDSFETDRSARSGLRSSPVRSVRSHKSRRSMHSRSDRSLKSSSSSAARRRGKLRRAEKRREWLRRWRRRRLLGMMLLTSIYSVLFAYTVLVTLGPLALHFGDPTDWCPLYKDDVWVMNSLHHYENANGYSLNIDQLQQPERGQQREVGSEKQRRKLVSRWDSYLDAAQEDLIGVEINLLRKTSKDVHSNSNAGGSDNNNNNNKQNDGSDTEQPDSADPTTTTSKYENPDYDDRPCHSTARIPSLFYLTLEECDLSRRMAVSVFFGGLIGYERRAADRPAGIRTMALVALGSCFFTISSQQAFRDSPMTWDSSRVTAAIPSGVGFLGAGLIWKGSLSDGKGGEVHQVHGITTAASVWLAAAVGCGAGGALYAVTAYSTALIVLVLRYGPRLYLQNDSGFEDDDEEEDEDDEESESNNDKKFGKAQDERVPGQTDEKNNYEMHHMGRATNDTTTLRNANAARYGATDLEQNTVATLIQEDHRRQLERMNRLAAQNATVGSQFLSWLINLLPGRGGRAQPLNPYQEIARDRDVMRLLKRKKSEGMMSSRPSFCT